MPTNQSSVVMQKSSGHSRQSESVEEHLQSLVEILDDLDTLDVCIVLGRMKRMASSIRNSTNQRAGAGLSQRESQVLVLIAHGYTRREIAESLDISTHTSARHIANIYSKLGISSVAEATTYALERDLTSPAGKQ